MQAPGGDAQEHGDTVVALVGVSKRYRQGDSEVVALDGVDLRVRRGELVGVVGRSGSGKSTLLHIAGGFDRPDSGRVVVAGVDLGACSLRALARVRRRHVGFVFQFFQLVPGLTVRENVALPLALDARSDRGRVDDLLEQVGLVEQAGRLPGELSGGQMQRVAVARALVAEPDVVLADEPTGNLDSASAAAVLDLLDHQVRSAGAALVLVTHDPAAVARADRVLTVRDGRLHAGAAPGAAPGAAQPGAAPGAAPPPDPRVPARPLAVPGRPVAPGPAPSPTVAPPGGWPAAAEPATAPGRRDPAPGAP